MTWLQVLLGTAGQQAAFSPARSQATVQAKVSFLGIASSGAWLSGPILRGSSQRGCQRTAVSIQAMLCIRVVPSDPQLRVRQACSTDHSPSQGPAIFQDRDLKVPNKMHAEGPGPQGKRQGAGIAKQTLHPQADGGRPQTSRARALWSGAPVFRASSFSNCASQLWPTRWFLGAFLSNICGPCPALPCPDPGCSVQ